MIIRNFTFIMLDELRTLDLSFNQISMIEKFAFVALTKLNLLDLNHNHIRQIDLNGLAHCTIQLEHNQLDSFQDILNTPIGAHDMYEYDWSSVTKGDYYQLFSLCLF